MNIIIVDQFNPILETLSLLIEKESDLDLAGITDSLPHAISLMEVNQADVMLIYMAFPRKSNLEMVKRIKKLYHSLRILLIVEHLDVHSALLGFRTGVSGYLLRTAQPGEYLRAIRKAGQGGKYVMPWLAAQLVDELNSPTKPAPHEILTDREFLIMCLIAAGKSTHEIADQLQVSNKIITGYRRQILKKMNIRAIPDIAKYYDKHIYHE
ncbi:MAG TPA: response regulator transcription factor [Bacteroidales bacterium]|nr:response regulator transcription factor [Bacteroidales bacterium]HPS61457.1 response regulator transcription factor [Bacteroidales bacterium]